MSGTGFLPGHTGLGDEMPQIRLDSQTPLEAIPDRKRHETREVELDQFIGRLLNRL